MSTHFSWLHLTDFHQGMDEQDWLWPGVKNRFFEDLKRLHDKCGPWDLVLFTGDLTQRGRIKEFQQLDKVLAQLWKEFDNLGSHPKLLAVPGNHDLARPDEKKEDPSVRLLQYWDKEPNVQTELWEKAESPYRTVITEAFENYIDWLKKQPFKADSIKYGILPGDFSVTIEKDGAKLGVVGLNTCFLQLTGNDYEGKLVVHPRQFNKACGGDGPNWAKQHHVCLLMTHHPPAWLTSDAQQHLNEEIADHGRFAAHLCGHMHEAGSLYTSEAGTEAQWIWQGRSLFGLKFFEKAGERLQRSHGYTAGKIELNGSKGALAFWPRCERLQGKQRNIVPDNSIALTDDQHTLPRDFDLQLALEEQPVNVDLQDYEFDIFLSYPDADIVGEWVRDCFIPLLKFCLESKLNRLPEIFMAKQCDENILPLYCRKLSYSRCLIPILSPRYCRLPWFFFECAALKHRVLSGSQASVLPILASGRQDCLHAQNLSEQLMLDCRDYVYHCRSLRKSKKYMKLQDKITGWMGIVTSVIQSTPAWQSQWLRESDLLIQRIQQQKQQAYSFQNPSVEAKWAK